MNTVRINNDRFRVVFVVANGWRLERERDGARFEVYGAQLRKTMHLYPIAT